MKIIYLVTKEHIELFFRCMSHCYAVAEVVVAVAVFASPSET